MIKYISIICLWHISFGLYAQDPQFTQFYAAPLYLNPALAGTADMPRLASNFRSQWNNSTPFLSYSASYDQFFEGLNSGAGLMVLQDRAGSSTLVNTSVMGCYAYQLKLSNSWKLRSGLSMAVGQRSFDDSKLIFEDQLVFNNQISRSGPFRASQEQFVGAAPRTYADVGVGFFVYSEKYWLGLAGHHLNQPNLSLSGGVSPLPARFAMHAGTKIPFSAFTGKSGLGKNKRDADRSISPAIMYKMQGNYDQLDLGTYIHYNPIVLGFWYRGLPGIKRTGTAINQDAFAVLIGFQQENFNIGYSYDITVSSLSMSSGGSHEISLAYQLPKNSKKRKGSRREHIIPCPKF